MTPRRMKTDVARPLAIATVVCGVALALIGCSGGNSADGAWIAVEGPNGGGDVIAIDGDQIVYATPTSDAGDICPSAQALYGDAESGSLDLENTDDEDEYLVVSTGTIGDDKTSVVWDDENGATRTGEDSGTGAISMDDESIQLEYIFSSGSDDPRFVPLDSDEGQAQAGEACE